MSEVDRTNWHITYDLLDVLEDAGVIDMWDVLILMSELKEP